MSRLLAFGWAFVGSLACASPDPSPDVAAGCEPNPEQAAQPLLDDLAPGDRSLSRIAANRIAANRIAANRIAANRIAANRIAANGVALNAISLDGVTLEAGRIKAFEGSSNELVGTTAQGEEIRGEAFVGATVIATLGDNSEVELEITHFEPTERPQVVHYGLAFEGTNLCEAGIGMFVPGYWDETQTYHATDEQGLVASYTCIDGVIGKCVDWGYAGWLVGSDLHAACVRMGTADYCGSGVSFTKDGTAIDVFDAKALLQPEGDETFVFEAGWSPNGAVCVNRPRYHAVSSSGEAVLPSCWSNLPTCDSWDRALAQGAMIGNSSRLQARQFCD